MSAGDPPGSAWTLIVLSVTAVIVPTTFTFGSAVSVPVAPTAGFTASQLGGVASGVDGPDDGATWVGPRGRSLRRGHWRRRPRPVRGLRSGGAAAGERGRARRSREPGCRASSP